MAVRIRTVFAFWRHGTVRPPGAAPCVCRSALSKGTATVGLLDFREETRKNARKFTYFRKVSLRVRRSTFQLGALRGDFSLRHGGPANFADALFARAATEKEIHRQFRH